jgi:hypothetical protein
MVAFRRRIFESPPAQPFPSSRPGQTRKDAYFLRAWVRMQRSIPATATQRAPPFRVNGAGTE